MNREGKTIVRDDALAHIAQAVKRIWEQPEAAHGYGCLGAVRDRPTSPLFRG